MCEGVERLLSSGVRNVSSNDAIVEAGVNRGGDRIYRKCVVGGEKIVIKKGSSNSGIKNRSQRIR